MKSMLDEENDRRRAASPTAKVRDKSRRRDPRVPTHFEIRLHVEGATYPARCTSLSLGGMFIETELRLGYDARVALEFTLGAGCDVVHLDGTVRWFDARGLGIQFSPMGVGETHALSAFIEESRRALAKPSP